MLFSQFTNVQLSICIFQLNLINLPLQCYISLLIGYLEDRRPASNMDPYVVTALLAETTILWEPTLEAEVLAAKKLALKV